MCHVIFHVWGFSWRKILYFQQNISEKSSNISRKLLSLLVGVTKVNFMWCVFHNTQWYWSDNLCKLVTDQWRGSLGVRDSESCWFTEEIGTYMGCWESPGDLPLVIEIVVYFRSFRCPRLAIRQHFYHSIVEDHPVFPKNVCKNLLICVTNDHIQMYMFHLSKSQSGPFHMHHQVYKVTRVTRRCH